MALLQTGGPSEIRTRDQRIKSPLLYRLSYRPHAKERELYRLRLTSQRKTRAKFRIQQGAQAGAIRLLNLAHCRHYLAGYI